MEYIGREVVEEYIIKFYFYKKQIEMQGRVNILVYQVKLRFGVRRYFVAWYLVFCGRFVVCVSFVINGFYVIFIGW